MTRKLTTIAGAVPAIHASVQAFEDDSTASAVRVENDRYARRILDLENAIQHERDRLRQEHLDAMRAALGFDEAAE